MTPPRPRPGILDIEPYVPGGAAAPGAARIYKLSSNESALGASPRAIDAYRKAAAGLERYPDGSAFALREKLAARDGLNAEQIVCGAGSDELLQLLCRAFVGEGDNVIQTQYGFLVYALATKACGGEIRFAPERNYVTDIDAILDLVDDRTRIVFLANPNNPTGTWIAESELLRLREKLPEDVLLVIDAAYAEYVEEAGYNAGAGLVEAFDNVVMTRTFSKIYGLASLRLGWGYFPPAVADVINRIRGPFNVSAPALAAGAAALDDEDFIAKNRDHNRRERDRLAQRLGAMGLSFLPSAGNFILVRFPDAPARNSAAVLDHLRRGGVIVREMEAYGLGEWLRISIGTEEANTACANLLAELFHHDE